LIRARRDDVGAWCSGNGRERIPDSSAAYLFNAVTAFLGVLVFFQRSTFWRLLAAAMFAITLPYFFLEGSRNHFLAAVVPFLITYLFYGRHFLIIKLAILAVAFVCLKEGFKFVTEFSHGWLQRGISC